MHKAVAHHHTFYRFVSYSSRLLLPLPPSPLHHTDKTHLLLHCVSRRDKHHFSASVLLTTFPLSRVSLHLSYLDNRSHPACSGSMGEVDAGPIHLPDSGQLHQRPICPHWHRNRHHCFWPVWVLCHLPRKPVDAEAGERPRKASLQDEGNLNHVIYVCLMYIGNACLVSLQYAMFLSLVFLAELVAGISGFVFRHEVRTHCIIERPLPDGNAL